MGGWTALDLDFRRLLADQSASMGLGIHKPHSLLNCCWDWLRGELSFSVRLLSNIGKDKHGIRDLHSMLKSCWAQVHLNQSLLGFYAFGCFSKEERRGMNVSEYLNSIEDHLPSPWICPMTKCVFSADSREQSRWAFGVAISNIAVSWFSERVVIANTTRIEAWALKSQKRLRRIPIDAVKWAKCVAISEDGKLIVSGHRDGSVRLWHAHTGEVVEEPMHNHTGPVLIVAIRGK